MLDVVNNELATISKAVVALEQRMAAYKDLEAEYKQMKQALYDAMDKHGVKSWETPNGARITRVEAVPASVKTVTEFDASAFRRENPALYEMYQRDVAKTSSGRAGYVKITLSREP